MLAYIGYVSDFKGTIVIPFSTLVLWFREGELTMVWPLLYGDKTNMVFLVGPSQWPRVGDFGSSTLRMFEWIECYWINRDWNKLFNVSVTAYWTTVRGMIFIIKPWSYYDSWLLLFEAHESSDPDYHIFEIKIFRNILMKKWMNYLYQ